MSTQPKSTPSPAARSGWTIRPYRDADFDAIVETWGHSMTLDALTPADFVRRVLLDHNRCPRGLLVAELGSQVVGFMLCLVLRHPIEKIDLLENCGFVTAFGVRPEARRQGAASALLEEAERFFRERGRSEIAVAPYPPGYFIPGVDRERYADAVRFLEARGFRTYLEALGMDALIGQFELPTEVAEKEDRLKSEGLFIEPLPRARLTDFLAFMERVMPGDWVRVARERLRATASCGEVFDTILIARDGDAIVGYCQFDGEHFGPFGVSNAYQGRGIGTVLLARTLRQMCMRGHHAAYVLWTGERAARGVYDRLGFKVTRRFAVMRKNLAGQLPENPPDGASR